MAGPTTDPLGVVLRTQMDINRLSTLAIAIAAWTGDNNGRMDMVIKQSEINFELNTPATVTSNGFGTSMHGFVLENVSTV
jgi:hypothetical protein